MFEFRWIKEKSGQPDEKVDPTHREALHAEARAIEDKRVAERRWLKNLVMRAHLQGLSEHNHMGERLEIALGRRKLK